MLVVMVPGVGTGLVRGNRAGLDHHVIELGKGMPQTVSGFMYGSFDR